MLDTHCAVAGCSPPTTKAPADVSFMLASSILLGDLFTDMGDQMARRKFGAGDKIEQRSETPGSGRPDEVESWHRAAEAI